MKIFFKFFYLNVYGNQNSLKNITVSPGNHHKKKKQNLITFTNTKEIFFFSSGDIAVDKPT